MNSCQERQGKVAAGGLSSPMTRPLRLDGDLNLGEPGVDRTNSDSKCPAQAAVCIEKLELVYGRVTTLRDGNRCQINLKLCETRSMRSDALI